MSKRRKKNDDFDKPETLAERLRKVSKGLYYISETDAEIFPFVGEKAESVTPEIILKQTEADAPVEERNFEDFFKRLTGMQNWFGEEEIANANKFSALKDLLEKNLRDLKVFKIGKIEIDIYVVGLDDQNILTGIKTKAVET